MTCYTDCLITEVTPQKSWTVNDLIDDVRDGLGERGPLLDGE